MKIAALCAALSFTLCPAIAADIALSSPTFSAGRTLRVQMDQRMSGGQAFWVDKKVPFYQAGTTWRALLGGPFDLAPGFSDVRAVSSHGEWSARLIHETGNFGTERIEFNKEKSKLLNDPAEEDESTLIREKLKLTALDAVQHWQGKFLPVVPGRLISPFGLTRDKKGQKKPDVHKGIDLYATKGEPVKATAAGTVLLAQNFKFHGNTVLLNHGQGVGSIVIHLDDLRVKEGERVKAGQVLGGAGMTGLATAPHVHWGVYVHGQAVDPLQWVDEEF